MTPPAPLYGRVPGISKAIEEVVFTALAKDPLQRFASMQAWATAIERACELVHMHLAAPPLAATQLDQSNQPTYIVTPPGQSVQSAFGGSPATQSSQPTYVVTPPGQPVLPGQMITHQGQQSQPGETITSSNESAWPTELVTQPGQGSESSIKNPPVPPAVVNAQASTIPPQGDTSARPAKLTSAENVLVQPTNDFPKPPRRNGRRLLIASALILLLLLAPDAILAVPAILASFQRSL